MDCTDYPLFRQLDAYRAAAARDRAIAAVDAHADPDARQLIALAIEHAAQELPELTTDDVWSLLPAELADAVEPRVMGAAMIAAARSGIIAPVPGAYRASAMVRCHRRPKQVWRSLVWRQEVEQ